MSLLRRWPRATALYLTVFPGGASPRPTFIEACLLGSRIPACHVTMTEMALDYFRDWPGRGAGGAFDHMLRVLNTESAAGARGSISFDYLEFLNALIVDAHRPSTAPCIELLNVVRDMILLAAERDHFSFAGVASAAGIASRYTEHVGETLAACTGVMRSDVLSDEVAAHGVAVREVAALRQRIDEVTCHVVPVSSERTIAGILLVSWTKHLFAISGCKCGAAGEEMFVRTLVTRINGFDIATRSGWRDESGTCICPDVTTLDACMCEVALDCTRL